MNDERSPVDQPENRPENRQVERDSQLSAMFDGELSAAECELLARRLTRDEALRSQWSRFAMIGAALRAERGVALHDRVAWRVQSAVIQEASYGDAASVDVAAAHAMRTANAGVHAGKTSAGDRWMRFARPVFGAGIAAGVAATSILWLRNQETTEPVLARNAVPQTVVMAPEKVGATLALNSPPVAAPERAVSNGEPERYSTPAPSSQTNLAPQARLANYVVAHSEYSGPLSRRMALLGLVATENTPELEGTPIKPGAAAAPVSREANDAH
jgi:negative regulator of sigma E activity